MKRSSANAGFTLIELMITLVIMAVVITIGIPSLSNYVAAQRVRTTASDLVADIAFARAEAIKESRQAIMEPLDGPHIGPNKWTNGWRICVDLDRGSDPNREWDCNSSNVEVRKISSAVTGRSRVCATTSDFDTKITFRPDGRVKRISSPGANDGIKVSDNNDDADSTNDRIRLIFIGVSGRPRMEIQDNDPEHPARGTVC